MEPVDEPRDFSGPIKNGAVPRGRILTGVRKRPPRRAQTTDRAVAPVAIEDGGACAPERPPHTFGRIRQGLLEPATECAIVEPARLSLRQDREERIDRRFDGSLAKQIGAEPMDGVDVCVLERLERCIEPLAPLFVCCGGPILLETLTQAQLQFASGLLGERHRHDVRHGGASAREHAQDPVDELGGLARACGGLHDQRVVEIGHDCGSSHLIGRLGNRM